MTKSSDTEQSQVRKHWQDHVKTQQKSGLSRAEYCRQHDLSYHALTYWQKKLTREARQHPGLVPVPVEKILSSRPGSSSGVRIILNGSAAIEVAEQFSPGVLRQVLCILEGR